MILLIDSASLWYRAYYGMPDSLRSPTGAPIHMVRGFLDSMARLITAYSPNQVVACLDGDWRPAWRTELLPEYKAAREDGEVLEDLESQIPILLDVLDAIGIPIIGIDDYEADDVIATLAIRESSAVVIATGDRDLFQLVDDKKPIRVAYLAKGIAAQELVDLTWIKNKYQIPGDRYGLMALLRGDPSDGLPGVRGIGEKGAALIVNNFASVEEILRAAKEGDARLTLALRRKIIAGSEYLRRAEPVTTCVRDLRLPSLPNTLPKQIADPIQLKALESEHGIATSVSRLLSALSLG